MLWKQITITILFKNFVMEEILMSNKYHSIEKIIKEKKNII